jgi:hypothetical protein
LKEIHIYKKTLNQLPFPKRKNNKKEDGCSYNERKRKMRKVKRLEINWAHGDILHLIAL